MAGQAYRGLTSHKTTNLITGDTNPFKASSYPYGNPNFTDHVPPDDIDLDTNTGLFKVHSNGIYRFEPNLIMTRSVAGNSEIKLRVNGTLVYDKYHWLPVNQETKVLISHLLDLNNNDTIELTVNGDGAQVTVVDGSMIVIQKL